MFLPCAFNSLRSLSVVLLGLCFGCSWWDLQWHEAGHFQSCVSVSIVGREPTSPENESRAGQTTLGQMLEKVLRWPEYWGDLGSRRTQADLSGGVAQMRNFSPPQPPPPISSRVHHFIPGVIRSMHGKQRVAAWGCEGNRGSLRRHLSTILFMPMRKTQQHYSFEIIARFSFWGGLQIWTGFDLKHVGFHEIQLFKLLNISAIIISVQVCVFKEACLPLGRIHRLDCLQSINQCFLC